MGGLLSFSALLGPRKRPLPRGPGRLREFRAQIIERLVAAGPQAARFRRRIPTPVGQFAVVYDGPIGAAPDSPTERWSLGYLSDVILTWDPWVHRTDMAAAAGAELTLTAEHDGALVADAVQEWATRPASPWTSCSPRRRSVVMGRWRSAPGARRRVVLKADGLLAVWVPF